MNRCTHIILSVALLLGGICPVNNLQAAPAAKANTTATPATKQAPARDWTKVVSATKDGGYMMGNPAAKIHVIEYASYTCPHCKRFHDEGLPKLLAYVQAGKATYEFRTFLIHGAIDVIPSLITYCQTPQRFFPVTDVFYNHFDEWTKGLGAITSAEQETYKNKPILEALNFYASKGGVVDFLRRQGLPGGQVTACLNKQATLTRLQDAQKKGVDGFGVNSTPTFIVNGDKLPPATNADLFADLDAKIKSLL